MWLGVEEEMLLLDYCTVLVSVYVWEGELERGKSNQLIGTEVGTRLTVCLVPTSVTIDWVIDKFFLEWLHFLTVLKVCYVYKDLRMRSETGVCGPLYVWESTLLSRENGTIKWN